MQVVGRFLLRLIGWRITGALPPEPRYILIVAPHTSNWDFFVGLFAKWALGLDAAFLAKHTLFRGPVGWALRALGGIPVDRARPEGTVEGVVARARAASSFVLAVTPEGTRKRSTGWKSGFHRIALAAGIPIVPVSFDWSTHTVGLGAPFRPTSDAAADIVALRHQFTRRMARHPELFADVRDPRVPAAGGNVSTEVATFGGGCFWCLEAVFEQLRGVERVVSGYAGGTVADPTYDQVCAGRTGHAEVVQVTFDPAVVTYRDLLDAFFAIHDPTTLNRQGADVGPQYRSIILTHSDRQRADAMAAIRALNDDGTFDAPVVTEVGPATAFYAAEAGHQGYFRRNGAQPYCQVVIAPKVAEFRRHHLDRLRA